MGKPIDEKYYEEYKEVYKEVFKDIQTPVLYNMNFGHSVPKCILPYDAEVTVDYDNNKVFVVSNIFENFLLIQYAIGLPGILINFLQSTLYVLSVFLFISSK